MGRRAVLRRPRYYVWLRTRYKDSTPENPVGEWSCEKCPDWEGHGTKQVGYAHVKGKHFNSGNFRVTWRQRQKKMGCMPTVKKRSNCKGALRRKSVELPAPTTLSADDDDTDAGDDVGAEEMVDVAEDHVGGKRWLTRSIVASRTKRARAVEKGSAAEATPTPKRAAGRAASRIVTPGSAKDKAPTLEQDGVRDEEGDGVDEEDEIDQSEVVVVDDDEDEAAGMEHVDDEEEEVEEQVDQEQVMLVHHHDAENEEEAEDMEEAGVQDRQAPQREEEEEGFFSCNEEEEEDEGGQKHNAGDGWEDNDEVALTASAVGYPPPLAEYSHNDPAKEQVLGNLDLLTYIMAFNCTQLPPKKAGKALARMSRVSNRWLQVSSQEVFWKPIVEVQFPLMKEVDVSRTSRQTMVTEARELEIDPHRAPPWWWMRYDLRFEVYDMDRGEPLFTGEGPCKASFETRDGERSIVLRLDTTSRREDCRCFTVADHCPESASVTQFFEDAPGLEFRVKARDRITGKKNLIYITKGKEIHCAREVKVAPNDGFAAFLRRDGLLRVRDTDPLVYMGPQSAEKIPARFSFLLQRVGAEPDGTDPTELAYAVAGADDARYTKHPSFVALSFKTVEEAVVHKFLKNWVNA